jgi:2-polyprenyl-3-methyl-5-hydroxy-6-metoxy-1,4-benzoquinol methylase
MTVKCRLCAGEAKLAYCVRDLNRRLSGDVFNYYRCSHCKAICLMPTPTDLGRYYPPEYYPLPGSLDELVGLAEAERYKLGIIATAPRTGRLLDIGASVGAFAYLAKQAGFDVTTIEMDPACCQFLEGVVGVRAIQSDNPAVALRGESDYDVITLWHVIEHLSNPWDVVAQAARKLRPGGLLVIAAPNPESLQFRVFGRYWMHFDAPRHLQLIPVAEIIRRAAPHGLVPHCLTTRDRGTAICNFAGWRSSTSYWFTDHSLRIFRGLAGHALALLAKPLDSFGRLGSAYTVVLTKRSIGNSAPQAT